MPTRIVPSLDGAERLPARFHGSAERTLVQQLTLQPPDGARPGSPRPAGVEPASLCRACQSVALMAVPPFSEGMTCLPQVTRRTGPPGSR